MKKVFSIIVVVLCIISITGCGKKYIINNCELEIDQSANDYITYKTYKIYSDKDIVDKVEITEEVKSNKKEILDYFEKQLEKQYSEANDKYNGYKYSIKQKNSKVTAKVTINYKKVNMEKYIDDNSAIKNYVNSDNKITKEGIINMYKSMEASCK